MKTKFFTLFIALVCATSVFAHDFEVNGIYYNYNNSLGHNAVEVTYCVDGAGFNDYSGSVTIPETVDRNNTTYRVIAIGDFAFRDCSNLTSITIPGSVKQIGVNAFAGCSSLQKTNYTGDVASWCKIAFANYRANPIVLSYNFYLNDTLLTDLVIPVGVDSIADYAFDKCQTLTSVTIGSDVKYIGESAFYSNIGLTSLTIPNSVTFIGDDAFYGCSGIRQAKIGSGIEEVGNFAFSDCIGLVSLTIAAEFPPIVQATTFHNISTTIIIKVPCGTADLYKAALYWNDFYNYQAGVVNNFSAESAQKTQGKVTIIQQPDCENNSVAIFEAVPYKGYEFIGWSDGSTEAYRVIEITEDVAYLANFTTSGTSVENITSETKDATRKVIEDGTIYILREGEAYTTDGRKVK